MLHIDKNGDSMGVSKRFLCLIFIFFSMKNMKKNWAGALFALAVLSVILLVMHLFDGRVTEEAKNFIYWAMVVTWVVGTIGFSFDFGGRNELSLTLKSILVSFFGFGLSLIGLLFLGAEFLTEMVFSAPFMWASVGYFCTAVFITGLLMEIQVFSHMGRKDWRYPRLWGTLAGGFVLMALAVILISQSGLLPLKEVVIIASSLIAMSAGAISLIIIISRRIWDNILEVIEKIRREI